MGAAGRIISPSTLLLHPKHPLIRNLIGAWKVTNTGAGGVYDYSKYANHGTLTGTVIRDMGPHGPSLNFDGSTGYVNLGSSSVLQPALPVTIAALFKIDSFAVSSVASIVSLGEVISGAYRGIHAGFRAATGELWTYYGAGSSPFASNTRSFTTTNQTVAGVWYFGFFRIGGATDQQIVINGVNWTGTTAGSGGALVYGGNNVIGREANSFWYLDGSIALVYVWNINVPLAWMRELTRDPWALFRRSNPYYLYQSKLFIYGRHISAGVDYSLSGSNIQGTINTAYIGIDFDVTGLSNTQSTAQSTIITKITPITLAEPTTGEPGFYVNDGTDTDVSHSGTLIDSTIDCNIQFCGGVTPVVRVGSVIYAIVKKHTINGWSPVLYKSTNIGVNWSLVTVVDSTEFGDPDAVYRRYATVALAYDSSTGFLHIVYAASNNPGGIYTCYWDTNTETLSSITTIYAASAAPPAAIATNNNGKSLIVGHAGAASGRFRYSFFNGSVWSSWADVPGSSDSAPANYCSTAYCSIDNRFHVMLGRSGHTKVAGHWLYNIDTDTWVLASDKPFPTVPIVNDVVTYNNSVCIVADSTGKLHAVVGGSSPLSDANNFYNQYNGSVWGTQEGFGDSAGNSQNITVSCDENNNVYISRKETISFELFKRISAYVFAYITPTHTVGNYFAGIATFSSSFTIGGSPYITEILSSSDTDKCAADYLLKDLRVWNFSDSIPANIENAIVYHAENQGAISQYMVMSGLKARWRFDDKTGNIQLRDFSVNNQNADIVWLSGIYNSNIPLVKADDLTKHNFSSFGLIDDFGLHINILPLDQYQILGNYKKISW